LSSPRERKLCRVNKSKIEQSKTPKYKEQPREGLENFCLEAKSDPRKASFGTRHKIRIVKKAKELFHDK
jgi:hypothetical protein